MPRTDKSVAVLTGLIMAALYVIMLVGFSRESYIRRESLLAAAANAPGILDDTTNRCTCRIDREVCVSDASRRGDPAAFPSRMVPYGAGMPSR
jgi:hypothetical protein